MLTTRYRRHLRDYPNLQLLEKGPNVLLVGFAAPLVMLGNCLPAIAAGLAISQGTIYLAAIGLIGWFGGINWLNKQADKTTAFNLAAVVGVVVAFAQAVALDPRVFAFCFLLQTLIAGMLARRQELWGAVAGFVAVGLAMATISIFGIAIQL